MRPRFVSRPILLILILLASAPVLAQRPHSAARVDEFDMGIENQMNAADDANQAMYAADRKGMIKDQGYRPKVKLAKRARLEFALGNMALSKSDFATAKQHFAAAVQVQPDFAIGHLNLGTAEMNLNELDAAKEEFQTASKLDPGLDMAFQNLGTLEIRRGNFSAAEEQLKTANRLSPKDLKTLTLLAYAQDLNHEFDSAVASAQRVHMAKDHRGYAFAHLIAGSALQASGKGPEAIVEYQLFLKEDPANPRADEARAAVKELNQNHF